MLPAVGQGTLAVEVREDDGATLERVAAVDDPTTRQAALAERAFLGAIGGSCTTPLAGYALLEGGRLRLRAWLATLDGARILREDRTMSAEDPEALGRAVAEAMLARGAREIVGGSRGP
jgi:hydroxymethylbilane synthase